VPGLTLVEHGAFGQNFTIAGLTEHQLCIGDVWSVGEARVQVSQPRQPCWKLARKWRMDDLPDRIVQSGRTGWYFRVLRSGTVEGGALLTLVERPHPSWTIAAANDVMYTRPHNLALTAVLAAVPELSASWRAALAGRAAGTDRS
jgi:MOSC domain-containing protein YiiM